jgi:hypothetical protein
MHPIGSVVGSGAAKSRTVASCNPSERGQYARNVGAQPVAFSVMAKEREFWRIEGRRGGCCSWHRQRAKLGCFLMAEVRLRLVRYESGRAVSRDLVPGDSPQFIPA